MVDPGIELFVEFVGDRFDSAHPVRTHGVGAHFKRPTGKASHLFKAGEDFRRHVGIEAETPDSPESGSVGQHLAKFVVGGRFNNGKVQGNTGDGAGGGEGGSGIAA